MAKKLATTKTKNTARNADELGELIGLTPSETALMKYKAKISSITVNAITESDLSVNKIVERSGVARSKVSAVKNGATVSVYSTYFSRLLLPLVHGLQFRLLKHSTWRKFEGRTMDLTMEILGTGDER